MKDRINILFETLSKSKFRSRFHLSKKDLDYINEKGIDKVESHAKDFVSKRVSSNMISNDGKQTPMRGHPVFIAQHATATCCRGCIEKWHKIPKGRCLSVTEQEYIVKVIVTLIKMQLK